jgi:hypothetical protein
VCLVGDRSRRRDVLVAAVDVDNQQHVAVTSLLVVTISSSINTSLCPIGEAREGLPDSFESLGPRISLPES